VFARVIISPSQFLHSYSNRTLRSLQIFISDEDLKKKKFRCDSKTKQNGYVTTKIRQILSYLMWTFNLLIFFKIFITPSDQQFGKIKVKLDCQNYVYTHVQLGRLFSVSAFRRLNIAPTP
jgi:hypothetical protein